MCLIDSKVSPSSGLFTQVELLHSVQLVRPAPSVRVAHEHVILVPSVGLPRSPAIIHNLQHRGHQLSYTTYNTEGTSYHTQPTTQRAPAIIHNLQHRGRPTIIHNPQHRGQQLSHTTYNTEGTSYHTQPTTQRASSYHTQPTTQQGFHKRLNSLFASCS